MGESYLAVFLTGYIFVDGLSHDHDGPVFIEPINSDPMYEYFPVWNNWKVDFHMDYFPSFIDCFDVFGVFAERKPLRVEFDLVDDCKQLLNFHVYLSGFHTQGDELWVRNVLVLNHEPVLISFHSPALLIINNKEIL